MGDIRGCAQCGALFTPRREHARFCSADCRVDWNRNRLSDPAAEASALQWSVTAMSEAVDRLPQVRPWDRERAFAVISEMVWWVTIVDATLVRYHPETYDGVMADQGPAGRQVVEGTLAGLRFVRNRMRDLGHEDFILPNSGLPRTGPGPARPARGMMKPSWPRARIRFRTNRSPASVPSTTWRSAGPRPAIRVS